MSHVKRYVTRWGARSKRFTWCDIKGGWVKMAVFSVTYLLDDPSYHGTVARLVVETKTAFWSFTSLQENPQGVA